jgi:lipoprotein-releasing system permease protein
MVLGTAVYDGFEKGIINKFYNSWGNVHIMMSNADETSFAPSDTLYYNASLMQQIKNVKGVASVAPISIQSALLKSKNNYEGIMLKGIDTLYDLKKVSGAIIAGKALQLADSIYAKQILLSKVQAKSLQVQAGDSVIAYVVLGNAEAPRARKLVVRGIYETGLYENDKAFAFVDARLVRVLQNDTAGRIFSYEVNTVPGANAKTTRDAIFQACLQPPMNAYTTEERFRRVFQWLALVKQNLSTIYFILIVVALINIATGLLILILERTKMIGMLKSFGARNWLIQKIFIWQNVGITIVGVLLGIALALTLGWVQYQFKILKLDPEVYYVDHVQLYFDWIKILQIAASTLGIFSVAVIAASFVVSFISPLKAIRFD